MLLDVLQVRKSARKLHSTDGLGNLTSVLERHTEESTTCLRSVGGVGGSDGVADLVGRDPELAFVVNPAYNIYPELPAISLV